MTLAYVAQFSLTPIPTDVNIQKINGLALKTYRMTTVRFSIEDKLKQIKFFKEAFLLADTSIEVISEMPFFFLCNANIHFDTKKLI